jgi:hypothetical protein
MSLPFEFPMPVLAPTTIAVIRVAYGVLLLVFLLQALPQARRFFLAERWGGYGEPEPGVEAIGNPVVMPVILAMWIACAVALAAGLAIVPAALVNLVLSRHFFVGMRWKGLVRGMGAPGFMTYWLAGCVFLLECTREHAPGLASLAVLVLQADFALIMFSAGLYKATAGYPRYHGMELGMVNPQWGYWSDVLSKLPPQHWLFKVLDQLAWSTEVVAAVLMLIPATRFWGAFLIFGSFVFIGCVIRLGVLCEMVMLCCLVFACTGTPAEPLLAEVATWFGPIPGPAAGGIGAGGALEAVLRAGLVAYLVLLPVAHGGQFYNFYGKRKLPGPWQRLHEIYTNFFGIIIWRVFSADHTSFFVRVFVAPRQGEDRRLVSHFDVRRSLRFHHVAENITLTTLFTTQKYFPSQVELFHRRLVRYARTIGAAPGDLVVLQYVRIVKTSAEFVHVPAAEFVVDPASGTVAERILDATASVRDTVAASPVHEGARPGSYVPLGA